LIPDALSRLLYHRQDLIITVELSPKLISSFIDGYSKDLRWSTIYSKFTEGGKHFELGHPGSKSAEPTDRATEQQHTKRIRERVIEQPTEPAKHTTVTRFSLVTFKHFLAPQAAPD